MRSVSSDLAYDFIRERILSGEYAPGSPLMTEQLAEVVGVSRTPIRDALRQLESDGLATIQPRLGASVTKMDLQEFLELCDLRLALEGHTAALAATHRSKQELAEVKFALESMRVLTEQIMAADKEDPLLGDLVKADVRFHIAIMTAAHNQLMKKEILRLHLINRVVANTGESVRGEHLPVDKVAKDAHRKEVMACHDEIYAAIAKGDAVAAKAAMERHIQDIIARSVGTNTEGRGPLGRELTAEELVYTA